MRVLADTRDGQESVARSIGIDREMALAVYRIGSDDEFAEVRANVIHPRLRSSESAISCNLESISNFYRIFYRIFVGFWSDFIRIFRVVDLRHLRRVYWALITPSAVKTPKRFDHLIDYFDINYEK